MSAGRVMGVDLGARRIGLAASDPGRVIASPHGTLARTGDTRADHDALLAIARDLDVRVIVVGLPRSLSGGLGPAALATLAEVDEMRLRAGDAFEIETYDERLTTVVATQALTEAGVASRDQRDKVDKVAAAVLLQGWLEAQK